jgi:hypothetical protein
VIKRSASAFAATVLPQCRFETAIFVLGHMRCGSTALSRVLCQHPAVSGYGEAHIHYGSRAALGTLALNQMRRGAFRHRATRLFDKILHDRYDGAPDPGFYSSRAVFLFRTPRETIRSIRKLFAQSPDREYASDNEAADYYELRLTTLARHWELFPAASRVGLSYASLAAQPDAELTRISRALDLFPALENRYEAAPAASEAHGSGDPLSVHRFDRIVPRQMSTTLDGNSDLDLAPSRIADLQNLHDAFLRTVMSL